MAATTPTSTNIIAGPLTTPFVPPSYCATAIAYELGVTCDPDGSIRRASGCFPSGLIVSDARYLSQIFSPAIACPVGWTSDRSSLSTVTCCPSYFSAEGQSCVSMTTLSPGYNDIKSCSGSVPLSTYITPWSATSSISSHTVWAIQLQLVVNPEDSFTVFTGSLISSRTSSSARLASSSSTESPTGGTPTADPEPGPKKLSGGAIAGIVIGVLAVFTLIIGAVFLFLRRRKQRKGHDTSTSGPHADGDLPEFVAPGPQPYANSLAHRSQTKIPPVIIEKTNTPSLRTGVSPVPTTPTQPDRNELFFANHSNNRTSDVSELVSPQMHQQGNRDTYTTTSSTTYPRSPLSELASFETPHQSTINHDVSSVYASGQEPEYQPTDRDSQVARLEAEKAMLDKLKARQLAQIEQEQANLQAELVRLRGNR